MTYTAIVMYPNEADINVWKSHGLISWRVTKFPTALDGSPSQFLIMATLEWESQEAVQAALQNPGTAGVFADIPNFTNVKPVTLAGSQL
ncbi:unnamed protein product [Penicillium discolor]